MTRNASDTTESIYWSAAVAAALIDQAHNESKENEVSPAIDYGYLQSIDHFANLLLFRQLQHHFTDHEVCHTYANALIYQKT